MLMEGNFYFITDEYFNKFKDERLMKNKELLNGNLSGRPAFYGFLDEKTNIYWMIPISSKVYKFEQIYKHKILKSSKNECDTIIFGYVLGKKRAFLIQNMCPIIPKYISNIYKQAHTNTPVTINQKLQKEIIKKAKKVLLLVKKGYENLILPNVVEIEKELIKEISSKEILKKNVS